ncbi:hypothetical protein M433DRAFT_196204 [Acidomyces richmondensis BFW]|nr:hypothetical protein M433DRAFT_196204 [Acidomyces richmondensis BFW]
MARCRRFQCEFRTSPSFREGRCCQGVTVGIFDDISAELCKIKLRIGLGNVPLSIITHPANEIAHPPRSQRCADLSPQSQNIHVGHGRT